MIIQGMTLQEMANYLVNLSKEQLLKLGETNSVLRTSLDRLDTVEQISRSAFCDCTSLKSIEIPNSIERISERTFLDCESLKSINIPSSVTRIESGAFCSCNSLENVYLSSNISEIADDSFPYGQNLTLHVPDDSFALQFAIDNGFRYIIEP